MPSAGEPNCLGAIFGIAAGQSKSSVVFDVGGMLPEPGNGFVRPSDLHAIVGFACFRHQRRGRCLALGGDTLEGLEGPSPGFFI
jgi:hypothetical protein